MLSSNTSNTNKALETVTRDGLLDLLKKTRCSRFRRLLCTTTLGRRFGLRSVAFTQDLALSLHEDRCQKTEAALRLGSDSSALRNVAVFLKDRVT
jgi:hypothetical protein